MDKYTHFQEELERLKENLLKMATLVEKVLADAVESLMKRDSQLAQQTIVSDDAINDLEITIEETCLKLLALQQPMAIDLRFITAAMKIVTDLERMGDQAVNIAERAISLNQEPQLKPYIDLPRMAEITQSMVKDVLDAFVKQDSQLARSVCARDDLVDGLNDQVFRELLDVYDFGFQDDPEVCPPDDREPMPGKNCGPCDEHCRGRHLHDRCPNHQTPR